ncbi:hypothetical protein MMC26_001450 [Xylographa opegraphella]|nr:hypothetical protein [Xylographa opegraphella]
MIIGKTSDKHTLRQWRRTCQFVSRVVNKRLYALYTINERTLNTEMQGMNDLLTFLDPPTFVQPKALYVKDLCLRWDFIGFCSDRPDDDGRTVTVLDETLVHALELAIPAMPALTEINHYGYIYQESLLPLTKAKSLLRLNLRSDTAWGNCMTWRYKANGERVLRRKPYSDMKLNLSILGNFAGLRRLVINNLLPGEGHSLGLALKELHHLKTLIVTAVDRAYRYYKENPDQRGYSSIDDLLLAVFPEERPAAPGDTIQPSGFPKTLTYLSINDKNPLTATALDSDFFEFRAKSLVGLETLCIQLQCIYDAQHLSLASVLKALLSPSINYLEVELYENLDAIPKFIQQPVLVRKKRPRCSRFCSPIEIPSNDGPSLHEAPIELDAIWDGHASYRQIGLGHWLSSVRNEVQGNYLTAHLFDDPTSRQIDDVEKENGIYQLSVRQPSSWGRDMRHIVAPILRLDKLLVDANIAPGDTSFDALRVLVLAPREPKMKADRPRIANRGRYYTPGYSNRPRYPTERDIAIEISHSRLPCLRVVVVGAYTFWFEMPEDRTSQEGWKVWAFDLAFADDTQRAVMNRELHSVDWNFFSRSYGARRWDMVSYIVMRRVGENDGWRRVAIAERDGLREERRETEEGPRVNLRGHEVDDDGYCSCEIH